MLTVATSFALASVAPCGTTSVRLWLLASVRALRRLGCNLGTTDSFKMIDALAPIASFPIRGTVARHETYHICHNVGHYYRGHWAVFRQCVSR